jgi:hypothetical protein
MVKKFSFIIFLFLLFTSTNAFAGDIPESIMFGKQKALFIGKITAINDDTYSITTSTIMMGNIQQSEIQIKKFNKYYGTNDKPKVGNFILAVLIDDNNIDDTWVFKTTSQDYKALKLVSEPYGMVIRYEEYINEGKYIEAQKKIDENNKASILPANSSVEAKDITQSNQVQSHLTKSRFVLILLVTGIIVFFIVAFRKRHHR